MARIHDWMPGTRDGQIALAESWNAALTTEGTRWGVPPSVGAELAGFINLAKPARDLAANKGTRTEVIVADCKTKMEALKEYMRFIKDRHFKQPELSDADFARLGLTPPDKVKTPVPAPSGFAEADVSYPGIGTLELHCRPVEGQPPLDRRSDYGYRVYYGVLPPGGAGVEDATGKLRLLMKEPSTGDELPHSQWCRRQRERFYFTGQSGMRAYFCIRYENSKGDAGPWGPIFSAVIP